MCDYEVIHFTCHHIGRRLIKHCHFARNDAHRQCFGAWSIKREWISEVQACYPCAQRPSKIQQPQQMMLQQQQHPQHQALQQQQPQPQQQQMPQAMPQQPACPMPQPMPQEHLQQLQYAEPQLQQYQGAYFHH